MTKGDRVFPRWFPFARFGRDGKVRARMTVLTTSLDRRVDTFAANPAAMRALVADLREKVAAIRELQEEAGVGLEDPDDLWADLSQALEG